MTHLLISNCEQMFDNISQLLYLNFKYNHFSFFSCLLLNLDLIGEIAPHNRLNRLYAFSLAAY